MSWADDFRRVLRVRTNADNSFRCIVKWQVKFGAEGIGLCRTEHMFFESEQELLAVREMILSNNLPDRQEVKLWHKLTTSSN